MPAPEPRPVPVRLALCNYQIAIKLRSGGTGVDRQYAQLRANGIATEFERRTAARYHHAMLLIGLRNHKIITSSEPVANHQPKALIEPVTRSSTIAGQRHPAGINQ